MSLLEQLLAANLQAATAPEIANGPFEKNRLVARREADRQRQATCRAHNKVKALAAEEKAKEMGEMPEYLKNTSPLERNIPREQPPETSQEKAPVGVLFAGEDGNWHFNDGLLKRAKSGGNKSGALANNKANEFAAEALKRFGPALHDSSMTTEIATFYNVTTRTVRNWRKRTK